MSGERTSPPVDVVVLDFVFVPQGSEAPAAWRAARPEDVAVTARLRREPEREDTWPNSF